MPYTVYRMEQINSATQDLPYLTHRAIQENMSEILELIDIAEGVNENADPGLSH